MELKELNREKIFCEIIYERDQIIQGLFEENQKLKTELERLRKEVKNGNINNDTDK